MIAMGLVHVVCRWVLVDTGLGVVVTLRPLRVVVGCLLIAVRLWLITVELLPIWKLQVIAVVSVCVVIRRVLIAVVWVFIAVRCALIAVGCVLIVG